MKKKCKKVLSVILTGVMILSLSACGGGQSSPTGNSSNSVSSSDSAASGEETASGEKPVITFMVPSFYGTDLKNEHSDEVIAKYEEYTGTHVEWQWESNDTYSEKMGLTLMDKDNMPMVLTASGNLTANVVDAAKKGAFWDLTPYLKDSNSYPNLSKANENVLKALTVDDQIIGIYRARVIGRYGFSYRTDWAQAVGITEEPKTIEDVYNMLYKFTYEDPDGDGKDDTYGMEMTKYTGPIDIIQTWFGCGNEWVEQDGKLVPVHQTAEYKEALKWMKKIYDEGLVRRDWATVDSGTWSEGCKKGEAGVFIDVMDSGKRIWEYFIDNDVKSVTNPSENASMTMVGPINGATLATSGFNGYFLITKSGAKTEEDVKNCLHFLDKMNDNEMLVLADYGLEGITYDLNADGNIVQKGGLEPQYTPSSGLNQSICYIPNPASTSPTMVKTEPMMAQDAAYAVNEKVAVFNPALGYLANSEVNAEVGTDIEQIIEDARTQYICGQIDETGLDAAAKQWLERGGDRLVQEINELYTNDTAK
ncbi:ABC transporter substrate-binding protein [Anaerocolumna sedimenticola]|uniref:ABC transporter substrate-binding protein n=1 Tax=Anaerocolumna sedimenticola TaxID=2696063 RepID=A0A6P1TJH4_9FIRM|nr:extracellular solute-binding protein [Anaerocolumna sedimenticola]QHQ59418.1 ABC transporter substrate-binding protein [Anaerocolumna sedimenticola]